MKSFEEYGYVATYPELPGCITCGETLYDVILNLQTEKQWKTRTYDKT